MQVGDWAFIMSSPPTLVRDLPDDDGDEEEIKTDVIEIDDNAEEHTEDSVTEEEGTEGTKKVCIFEVYPFIVLMPILSRRRRSSGTVLNGMRAHLLLVAAVLYLMFV
jgi:hypothetical protein